MRKQTGRHDPVGIVARVLEGMDGTGAKTMPFLRVHLRYFPGFDTAVKEYIAANDAEMARKYYADGYFEDIKLSQVRQLLMGKPAAPYVVYNIYSVKAGRGYTGCTVKGSQKRRLRQHNGLIKGGAKATSSFNDWRLRWVLHCDGMDRSFANHVEYRLKKKVFGDVLRACQKWYGDRKWEML